MSVYRAAASERRRECLEEGGIGGRGGVEAIERLVVCPLIYKESRGLRSRRNARG